MILGELRFGERQTTSAALLFLICIFSYASSSTLYPSDFDLYGSFLSLWFFLDTQVCLAPTHVSLSTDNLHHLSADNLHHLWYFWTSILSASQVALREKWKKVGSYYFSILGMDRISWNGLEVKWKKNKFL